MKSASICQSKSCSRRPTRLMPRADLILRMISLELEELTTMSDVYGCGVGMIKFGRFPDRTLEDIGAEAALLALDDAGLTIHDMQALYCGNVAEARPMVGQR